MATRTYVGARYVPLIDGLWDKSKRYEPLTIVQDSNGSSWTSKKLVPANTPLVEGEYWAETGNYNAQLDVYIKAVQEMNGEFETKIDELQNTFTTANEQMVRDFNAKIAEVNNVVADYESDIESKFEQYKSLINYQWTGYQSNLDSAWHVYQNTVNGIINTNNNMIANFNDKLNQAIAGADAGTEVAGARYPYTSLASKMQGVLAQASLIGFMSNLTHNDDSDAIAQYQNLALYGFDVYNSNAADYPCVYFWDNNIVSRVGDLPSGLPDYLDFNNGDEFKKHSWICIYYGEFNPFAYRTGSTSTGFSYGSVGIASEEHPREYVYELYSLDGAYHLYKVNKLTGTNIVNNFVSGDWISIEGGKAFVGDFSFHSDLVNVADGVYPFHCTTDTTNSPLTIGVNNLLNFYGNVTVVTNASNSQRSYTILGFAIYSTGFEFVQYTATLSDGSNWSSWRKQNKSYSVSFDLNNILNEGVYPVRLSSLTANAPITVPNNYTYWGYVTVWTTASNSHITATQELYIFSDDGIQVYGREYSSSNGWNAWERKTYVSQKIVEGTVTKTFETGGSEYTADLFYKYCPQSKSLSIVYHPHWHSTMGFSGSLKFELPSSIPKPSITTQSPICWVLYSGAVSYNSITWATDGSININSTMGALTSDNINCSFVLIE